jgi:hypothetical protein
MLRGHRWQDRPEKLDQTVPLGGIVGTAAFSTSCPYEVSIMTLVGEAAAGAGPSAFMIGR